MRAFCGLYRAYFCRVTRQERFVRVRGEINRCPMSVMPPFEREGAFFLTIFVKHQLHYRTRSVKLVLLRSVRERRRRKRDHPKNTKPRQLYASRVFQ